MEEVIEDIISMQSSYDDLKNYVDPVAQMPNTVSEVTEPFFVIIRVAHVLVCLALLRRWIIQLSESCKINGKWADEAILCKHKSPLLNSVYFQILQAHVVTQWCNSDEPFVD